MQTTRPVEMSITRHSHARSNRPVFSASVRTRTDYPRGSSLPCRSEMTRHHSHDGSKTDRSSALRTRDVVGFGVLGSVFADKVRPHAKVCQANHAFVGHALDCCLTRFFSCGVTRSFLLENAEVQDIVETRGTAYVDLVIVFNNRVKNFSSPSRGQSWSVKPISSMLIAILSMLLILDCDTYAPDMCKRGTRHHCSLE